MPSGTPIRHWPSMNSVGVPNSMLGSAMIDRDHHRDGERQHQPAAADAVREPAAEHLGEQHHEEARAYSRAGTPRPPCRGAPCAAPPARREHEVVGRVRHPDDAERLHDRAPVRDERRQDRRADARGGLLALLGLVDALAQEPAGNAERDAAMNGMRQPHFIACALRQELDDEQRRARAEDERRAWSRPRSSCSPRPRIARGESSVVYTIEPVNSPPSEKPWTEPQQHQEHRRRDADLVVRWQRGRSRASRRPSARSTRSGARGARSDRRRRRGRCCRPGARRSRARTPRTRAAAARSGSTCGKNCSPMTPSRRSRRRRSRTTRGRCR